MKPVDSIQLKSNHFTQRSLTSSNFTKAKLKAVKAAPRIANGLVIRARPERVDVAILEVGLGGKLDSTNSVQKPVVCGVSSLGYDHMEILGDTLDKIAGEKAGIFKLAVPAITVPQPDEAMCVLEEKASQLNVNLQVVQPLTARQLSGQKLGLDGEHQYLNAGLAVSLASTWLQQVGKLEVPSLTQTAMY
ncbi:hypothetical protein DY000_02000244 [Brassica cretica]|uniref:Folylpoly-gamma-glutamate synthetase n=1 Tax=Brassica cretica TaxID=69181 RepID=A0ABQ7C9E2_BRACR|nr:hypothetical protein DY000_02000244 [Brassica cretica]